MPSPQPAPFDEAHFDRCFRQMLATLKRKNADEVSGALLVETYQIMLRKLPRRAIAYLTEQALLRCEWFPSVKECLAIAAEWKPPRSEADAMRTEARALITREKRLRFDEAMAKLARREMTQPEIDALPERWKMIAAERCYLWLHPDLTFTVRSDPDAGRFTAPAEDASLDEICGGIKLSEDRNGRAAA